MSSDSDTCRTTKKRSDPTWDHVIEHHENGKQILTCRYCEKRHQGGGINRLKHHLAREERGCTMVPPEIRFLLEESVISVLSKKKKPSDRKVLRSTGKRIKTCGLVEAVAEVEAVAKVEAVVEAVTVDSFKSVLEYCKHLYNYNRELLSNQVKVNETLKEVEEDKDSLMRNISTLIGHYSSLQGQPTASQVHMNFAKEPIGTGKDGNSVYFGDIWPCNDEVLESTNEAITKGNPMGNSLQVPASSLHSWDPNSTYIHEPSYFKNMTMDPPGPHGVKDAYCLLNFGDCITTDHFSPAGSIQKDNPAAKNLLERGVDRKDFNSYGSQRGNDEVMAGDTVGNIWIINKLLNGEVGSKTVHIPTGEKLHFVDVAMRYKAAEQDTIVLAGAEFGRGSSREWSLRLIGQGVKAVIAKSFERMHRSTLVCMGIIPLCFKAGEDAETLGLTGHERYTIDLPTKVCEIRPGQDVIVTTDTGKSFTCTARFDTEVELTYFGGGIL